MNYKKIQNLHILNNIMMAYFQNRLENEGIDLNSKKPTFPSIISIKDYYISTSLYVENEFIKEIYPYQLVLEFNLNDLDDKKVDNYLSDEMKNCFSDMAMQLAKKLNEKENYDLIFPLLPEVTPFISFCNRDEETGFTARCVYGSTFGAVKNVLIFDYHVLFVKRYRLVDNETWIVTS